MISIEQYDMIILSLTNANDRLTALEADRIISMKNDLDTAEMLTDIYKQLRDVDEYFVEFGMATRNPPVSLVAGDAPEETAPPIATVHHLNFKEPA